MARIFISYSRTDADAARDISRTLSQAGLEPWLDTVEIGPGDSFLERMNEGLREASYVLLLLSNASLTSRWVTREWMSAMASGRTVIVPILLENVEPPPLLRDILYIDFRDRSRGGEQLLSFFRKELRPLITTEPVRRPRGGVSPDIIRTLTLREIRMIAVACLTDEALSAFCESTRNWIRATSMELRRTKRSLASCTAYNVTAWW